MPPHPTPQAPARRRHLPTAGAFIALGDDAAPSAPDDNSIVVVRPRRE